MAGSYDDPAYQLETLERVVADLATQNNRCTAEPLFVVQVRELEPAHGDEFDPVYAFFKDGEVVPEALWAQLNELYEKVHFGFSPETDELSPVIELDGETYDLGETGDTDRETMRKVWRSVAWFLTENGAEQYIAENRHNLRGDVDEAPQIFVDSLYRCHEMCVIRRALPRMVELLKKAMADESAG